MLSDELAKLAALQHLANPPLTMSSGDLAVLVRNDRFSDPPWTLFADERIAKRAGQLFPGDVVLFLEGFDNGMCRVAAPTTGSVGYIEWALLQKL